MVFCQQQYKVRCVSPVRHVGNTLLDSISTEKNHKRVWFSGFGDA
jgi:hypothetical protein